MKPPSRRLIGGHLGDVQPGQRRAAHNIGETLVNRVVGTDKEVCATLRKLVG